MRRAHYILLNISAAIGLVVIAGGFAAAFTPGNLIVYRVADGCASPCLVPNPVILDENTTGGTFVLSIALPAIAGSWP